MMTSPMPSPAATAPELRPIVVRSPILTYWRAATKNIVVQIVLAGSFYEGIRCASIEGDGED